MHYIVWRRQWHPTPVLLPGKSHGWRSLVGYSLWGPKESDTTERLHFYFSLSCIGEGNGNPLQCSCLKNPRDGRAWWAAIYGVAQSRTQLTQLSSSSSSITLLVFIYLRTRGLYLLAQFSSAQSLSHVRLCATPEMAAHRALPSLGFFRQEHWSGLPFPSPMCENEK